MESLILTFQTSWTFCQNQLEHVVNEFYELLQPTARPKVTDLDISPVGNHRYFSGFKLPLDSVNFKIGVLGISLTPWPMASLSNWFPKGSISKESLRKRMYETVKWMAFILKSLFQEAIPYVFGWMSHMSFCFSTESPKTDQGDWIRKRRKEEQSGRETGSQTFRICLWAPNSYSRDHDIVTSQIINVSPACFGC